MGPLAGVVPAGVGMSQYQSRITGRAIKIVLPAREGEPEAETLVVEVEIDCP